MSDKPEPRLDVELSVRVFGMGANGRPFLQNVQARNISHHGAKLFGLETPLKPGDVIGVQFGDKKARCKVIWVVDRRAGAENLSGSKPDRGATLSLGKRDAADRAGARTGGSNLAV